MYPYFHCNPVSISQNEVFVELTQGQLEASSAFLPVNAGDQFSVYVESTSQGALGWQLLDAQGRNLSHSTRIYSDRPMNTGPYTVREDGALQLRIWCAEGHMSPCSGTGYISKITMPMEWE